MTGSSVSPNRPRRLHKIPLAVVFDAGLQSGGLRGHGDGIRLEEIFLIVAALRIQCVSFGRVISDNQPSTLLEDSRHFSDRSADGFDMMHDHYRDHDVEEPVPGLQFVGAVFGERDPLLVIGGERAPRLGENVPRGVQAKHPTLFREVPEQKLGRGNHSGPDVQDSDVFILWSELR